MSLTSLTQIPITERKDGRGWTFRYRAADGTRPRVTRPTLIEALVAWLELERDYVIVPFEQAAVEPVSTAPTLREFFYDVYCVRHLPDLSRGVQVQYRRYFPQLIEEVGVDPVVRTLRGFRR